VTANIKTAEYLLDLFQDEMCKQIELHTTGVEEFEQWIMPFEVRAGESIEDAGLDALRTVPLDRIIDKETAISLFAEYGCLICKIDEAYHLSDCHTTEGALEHTQDPHDCFIGEGDVAGDFHIHPVGLPIPSTTDLNFVLSAKAFCARGNFFFIGGKVGGRCVIVGYIVDETSKVRYEIFKKIMESSNIGHDLCYPLSDNWLGAVFLHREHPGLPTSIIRHFARQYLDDFYPPDQYSEKEREEAKKMIESGKIPDTVEEWVIRHQPEPTIGCITVYSGDVLRDGFKKRLEQLSKIFKVVVRWCD